MFPTTPEFLYLRIPSARCRYGAHAVCPYLAFETCRQWRNSTRTKNLIKQGRTAAVSIRAAQRNYKRALEKGVLKILSKMGISLLSCYHGAQVRSPGGVALFYLTSKK